MREQIFPAKREDRIKNCNAEAIHHLIHFGV
jgi:hypothetical protein